MNLYFWISTRTLSILLLNKHNNITYIFFGECDYMVCKTCPLLGKECIEYKCEWFDDGVCAVVNLAKNIDLVTDKHGEQIRCDAP